jgi:hypothetical protein
MISPPLVVNLLDGYAGGPCTTRASVALEAGPGVAAARLLRLCRPVFAVCSLFPRKFAIFLGNR